MVYVIYSFCSLTPLKWAPECFLVFFSIDTRVNYFLFKIPLNRTVFRCYTVTDSLSCLAEHLCNWFCKCFSIITTAVYISLDYYGKGAKSFDILTGNQELEVLWLHTDLKLTNHSAQNPLDAHAQKSLLLYIPSNNVGKNIINKSFNILDSDPIRSRVEGSPAFSRYPGQANFPYISLENSSNCL